MVDIFVKNGAPPWRPNQKKVETFKTKGPEGKIDNNLPVEMQFSKEELARIQAAAHFTNSLQVDQHREDWIDQNELFSRVTTGEIKSRIIKP